VVTAVMVEHRDTRRWRLTVTGVERRTVSSLRIGPPVHSRCPPVQVGLSRYHLPDHISEASRWDDWLGIVSELCWMMSVVTAK
jgi:hypothetical protein